MAYIFLLFCVIALVKCDNKGTGGDRKSRFISFDTVKNDIEVSLDFTVPFLSIPIKNTINSMFDGIPGLAIPKINVNPSALAFGGLIVLATSVLLPLFSKASTIYDADRYYRVLDNGNEETNMIMDFTNQFMSISRGCPRRIACWVSQRSSDVPTAKTVERIIRNKLVSSIFNTTGIEDAILEGRKGRDCAIYEPCPLREEHLPIIMRNFGILTSRNFT